MFSNKKEGKCIFAKLSILENFPIFHVLKEATDGVCLVLNVEPVLWH